MRLMKTLCVALCLQAGVLYAQALPQPVATALAQAHIPQSHVGVYVQEIDAKQPLIDVNTTQAMSPASVMKLVTTYSALRMLGPAYAWNTEIYVDQAPRDGVLDGNLYFKGHGDPKLSLENFWLMLNSLYQRGVRDIRGDLILDHSLFSVTGDPGAFDGKPDRPYNTLPDALLVGFKAINLTFVPQPDKHGVMILSEPLLPTVQFTNDIVLDNAPCGDFSDRVNADINDNGISATMHFTGHYSTLCGEKTRAYSVLSHRGFVQALFKDLWQKLGGKFSGTVRDDTVPANAQLLFTRAGPPLAEIVRDINKYSNNLMAREVFLTLGTPGITNTQNAGSVTPASVATPATAESAANAIRAWFAQDGLNFPELVLENGCGLSRTERISPQHLAQLLLDAYASPVMPELINSLPIVAADGTMKKRLAGTSVAARAHIKTGLLSDVRSMAGYVLDAQGRRFVVVFISNDTNTDGAQTAQDALLQWIYARP